MHGCMLFICIQEWPNGKQSICVGPAINCANLTNNSNIQKEFGTWHFKTMALIRNEK